MDLFDLLEQRAVMQAWEIVEAPETVASETLAVAVQVLALWKTGQLKKELRPRRLFADRPVERRHGSSC